MKTTVVCGLLGSGKTTFIQDYLKAPAGRTVVLVNDFGKAGIDGEIFSADGVEAIELPSGCVCCTLRFDLITTIQKIIREFSPDHLVIEPSGVAAPSGILEVLESLKITGVTVVGIVDATEFMELHDAGMFGSFFLDQILNSDIILVNKADLADEAAVAKTVSLVEGMNPSAVVVPAVQAVINMPLPGAASGGQRIIHVGGHLRFETISVKIEGGLTREWSEGLFRDLAGGRFGNVVRAKALVQTADGPYRFDLSFGKVDAIPFGRPVAESRLVAIGNGLDEEGVMATLQAIP